MASSRLDDGWDDDGLTFDDDEEETGQAMAAEDTSRKHMHGNTSSTDGWDDDWDFDDDDEELQEESGMKWNAQLQPTTLGVSSSMLQDYVQSLPSAVDSWNDLLEVDYNTESHAAELLEYYQERPQLVDYTLTTELPRMEYCVVVGGNTPDTSNGRGKQVVMQDKQQVHDFLKSALSRYNDDDSKLSLLLRSANQSLLADVLTALTGTHDTAFIRPQHPYMATAVATHCAFQLELSGLDDNDAMMNQVICNSDLQLCLPHPHKGRLPVATCHVTVEFGVVATTTTSSSGSSTIAPGPAGHHATVRYRVHSVELLTVSTPEWQEAAKYLHELSIVNDNSQTTTPAATNTSSSFVLRDAMFQQLLSDKTQQMLQDTNMGMAQALQQVDAVVNIRSKLQFLKVPTTEQILEASEMSVTANSSTSGLEAPPWRSASGGTAAAAAKDEPEEFSPQAPKSRPAPILSGLLRSGWSRLAKTVTLPEENEHGGMGPFSESSQQQSTMIPKLYRTEDEFSRPSSDAPQLHHLAEEQEESPRLSLYRAGGGHVAAVASRKVPSSTTTSPRVSSMPEVKSTAATEDREDDVEDEALEDGWDDELDGLDDDDLGLESIVSEPASSLSTIKGDTAVPLATTMMQPLTHMPAVPTGQTQQSASADEQDEVAVELRKRWRNPVPGPRRLLI